MSLRVRAWQPLLTPHMAHTLAALRDELGGRLDAIVDRRSDAVRESQGWSLDVPELVPEQLRETGWRDQIRQLVDEDPDTVHLFGSPFERSRINAALIRALRRGRRVMLVSEPYCPIAISYLGDRPGWRDRAKAALRPLVYRVYGRLMASRLSGVFAISPAAVSQYRRMGVPPSRIIPFGYFVPEAPRPAREGQEGLRLAYLGSFIARKGVDDLIRAVELAGSPRLRLDLYGPGWAGRPLPSGVAYRGRLAFGEVQGTLAGYDLVVVPSLFDGWAVVVNEAIQAGTPVIASDAVGAAAMIDTWRCGHTFPAGDAAALSELLRAVAADPSGCLEWRAQAERLRPLLDPAVAGSYMRQAIAALLDEQAPPPCPWYRT